MVDSWNEDEQIQKWVDEKRVFTQNIRSDEWSIWGVEGDNKVKKYINRNYSW